MKKMFPLILMACLFMVVLIVAAHAANVYVRDGGTGAGTSWSDALDQMPTTVRGNIYYVADGAYNGFNVSTALSGTVPITIKKATIADHGTSMGWSDAYGDGVAILGSSAITVGYVTLDGSFEYGFKISIGHGGRGLDLGGFGAAARSNITVKNLEIAGPAGVSPFFYTKQTQGIYGAYYDAWPYLFTDLLISHCYVHGCETLMLIARANNFVIEHCVLADSVSSNSDPNSPHPNIAYINSCDNVTFRYNEVRNWNATAYYQNNYSGEETRHNHRIYGNWFHDSGQGGGGGYPGCVYHSWGNFDGQHIYNNTFSNVYAVFSSYNSVLTNSFFKNNIIYNVTVPSVADVAGHNYNWFSGSSAQGEPNGIAGGSTNPFTTAPMISGTMSNVLPRNKGTNLGAPYNVDPTGAMRGTDGAWDIGAYEYGGAPAPTPSPTPPPLPTPSPTPFKIGDRIETITPDPGTNVRSEPRIDPATLLGTQSLGSLGTLTAGPADTTDGIIWWQTNYDNPPDGWTGSDNFKLSTAPAPTPTPTPTPTPGPSPTPGPVPPHTHTISEIQGLQEVLESKSDKTHTHNIPATQTEESQNSKAAEAKAPPPSNQPHTHLIPAGQTGESQ